MGSILGAGSQLTVAAAFAIYSASEGDRAAHPIAQGIRSRIRFVLVSIRISARPRKRYWRSSGSLGSTASMPAGMLANGCPVGYARLMRRDKSPGFSSMMIAIVAGFVPTSRTSLNSALMVDVKMSPCLAPARATRIAFANARCARQISPGSSVTVSTGNPFSRLVRSST